LSTSSVTLTTPVSHARRLCLRGAGWAVDEAGAAVLSEDGVEGDEGDDEDELEGKAEEEGEEEGKFMAVSVQEPRRPALVRGQAGRRCLKKLRFGGGAARRPGQGRPAMLAQRRRQFATIQPLRDRTDDEASPKVAPNIRGTAVSCLPYRIAATIK
jgi:hypothetical protein